MTESKTWSPTKLRFESGPGETKLQESSGSGISSELLIKVISFLALLCASFETNPF